MNPNDNQIPSTPPEEMPPAQPTPPSFPPSVEPTPPVAPTQAPEPFAPIQSSTSLPQPEMTQPEPIQPSGSRKKMVIIIGIIVGVLVIGGIVAAVVWSGRDGSPLQAAIESATGGTADVVDRTDGTLTLETTINKQDSLKAQEITAKLGQQINLSDGFSFMVSKVTPVDSFKRTSLGKETTVVPEEGNKFIEVSYVVGNRLESPSTHSFSSYSFDLVNKDTKDEYRAETFLSTDSLMPETYYNLDMDSLTSGMQTPFTLYYEVPSDAALYVERKTSYKNYETDEKIDVIGRVNL